MKDAAKRIDSRQAQILSYQLGPCDHTAGIGHSKTLGELLNRVAEQAFTRGFQQALEMTARTPEVDLRELRHRVWRMRVLTSPGKYYPWFGHQALAPWCVGDTCLRAKSIRKRGKDVLK